MSNNTEQNFPDPSDAIVEAWEKVRDALTAFSATAYAVQMHCPHTQAVQYTPRYFAYKRHDCQEYPFRVCVHCGLIQKAEEQLDPDTFGEYGPLYAAEILAEYDQGFRANHFRLPCMPPENRLDGRKPPSPDA